jgi:hypothetical protein
MIIGLKISWFDTDAYEYNKDDNNGYVFGIVSWVWSIRFRYCY